MSFFFSVIVLLSVSVGNRKKSTTIITHLYIKSHQRLTNIEEGLTSVETTSLPSKQPYCGIKTDVNIKHLNAQFEDEVGT